MGGGGHSGNSGGGGGGLNHSHNHSHVNLNSGHESRSKNVSHQQHSSTSSLAHISRQQLTEPHPHHVADAPPSPRLSDEEAAERMAKKSQLNTHSLAQRCFPLGSVCFYVVIILGFALTAGLLVAGLVRVAELNECKQCVSELFDQACSPCDSYCLESPQFCDLPCGCGVACNSDASASVTARRCASAKCNESTGCSPTRLWFGLWASSAAFVFVTTLLLWIWGLKRRRLASLIHVDVHLGVALRSVTSSDGEP